MDAILALRLLAELHRHFNRQLQVAYIDIKSAFDSVDRVALWKALVCQHFSFNSYVTCTQEQQLGFALLRVCQTCFTQHQESVKVVYLFLRFFCCAVDWLMRNCSGCFGVDVGNFYLTDINYADDAVLFTYDPTKWDYVFRNFEAPAGAMGLHTNWQKRRSKILELDTLQEQSILTIKQ